MNAADRKQVAALVAHLEELMSQASAIGEEIRELADAEQEKYDNMSEGLQQGDRGQAIEAAAQALSSAADAADEGNVVEALENLNNIES
jgi:uncharacterized coiled-coil DUF342 family protein